MHGKGKYVFRNGARYEGEFKDGAFDGHGAIYLPNEDIFYCEFKNGVPFSKGT